MERNLREISFYVNTICSIQLRRKLKVDEDEISIFGIVVNPSDSIEYINPTLAINTIDGKEYLFYFNTDEELNNAYEDFLGKSAISNIVLICATTTWQNSFEKKNIIKRSLKWN